MAFTYYPNGVKQFEGEYTTYNEIGKGKVFDLNGKLSFEGEFKNNQYWSGKGTSFDSEGNKVFEGEFKDGDCWMGKGF